MIDTHTQKPLQILPNGEQGGVLSLPAEQVDLVLKLFQDRGLRCWRDPEVMSVNGGPARGMVILSRNVKPNVAQAVLDQTP